MYVLADLEWVENKSHCISFTQIALLRVDAGWNVIGRFFSKIRPKKELTYRQKHVGFTGGSVEEFMNAPSSSYVFAQLAEWLHSGDIICWWYDDAKQWIQKVVPAITNEQIILSGLVSNYLGRSSIQNAYSVGASLGLIVPGAKHDARNDAEMMRRVLEHIQFPQPIPKTIEKPIIFEKPEIASMPYIYHPATNTIHKRECLLLPSDGSVKEYRDLAKSIGKGFLPCRCVKKEYMDARKVRNQDIIDRSQYNYLYTPNSTIFHRRGCKIMLAAKDIKGTGSYRKICDTKRIPCKICNPSQQDEYLAKDTKKSTPIQIEFSPKEPKNPPPNIISEDEQRALKRLQQAKMVRSKLYGNPTLSQEQRDDLLTLSQTRYTFFAAKGYQNFHLQHCRKLNGLSNVEGFGWYTDAIRAGYRPCKVCKPTDKYNAIVSLPIHTRKRLCESAETVEDLCRCFDFRHTIRDEYSYIETPVGIWKFNPEITPYRLEHINKVVTPNNTCEFHRQPRLFCLLETLYIISSIMMKHF